MALFVRSMQNSAPGTRTMPSICALVPLGKETLHVLNVNSLSELRVFDEGLITFSKESVVALGSFLWQRQPPAHVFSGSLSRRLDLDVDFLECGRPASISFSLVP